MTKRILQILDELNETKSRNKKEEILKREYNNIMLRKVFISALDPYTNYYIRKIPEYEKQTRSSISLSNAFKNLELLKNRVKTGNEAISYLQMTLENLEDMDAEVLERIIKKNLECGVSIKTVNKIWPKTIKEYPVMLCSTMNEKSLSNINYPAYVQEKLDGMRVNFHIHNGKVDVYSRNGRMIDIMGIMDDELLKLDYGNGLVLDGELLYSNGKGGYLPRKKGNGKINKAIKGTMTETESQLVVAVLWDSIDKNAFETETFDMSYESRYKWMKNNIKENDRIKLVRTELVDSFHVAKQFYEKILKEGGEGVIIKNMASIWENKRSKHHVKMKVENTADLMIVEVVEGVGKYEGKLGSFQLETSDGLLSVNVVSGFSDEQRDEYFTKKMIGKVLELKYNEKITNEKGDNSLFLPIFIEMRNDKNGANSFEELK